MKALFTLTSAESKRLIARAVAALPEVQNAFQKGIVIIGAGTTNAFILEELSGETVDKARYTAGIIAKGRQCITPAAKRLDPAVFIKGERSDLSWEEAVEMMGGDDVLIKGGNAIDSSGVIGIQMAHPQGGTIGKVLPIVVARGSHLILPIGLEKLIPDVTLAANISGIQSYDLSIGMKVGLMPVGYGRPITELEAIEKLAEVEAYCISAGGIDGSEGAVSLAIEGEKAEVEKIFALAKDIKGEKPLSSIKQACSQCADRCDYPG